MKLKAPTEVKELSYREVKSRAGFAGVRVVGYEIHWTDIHGVKHVGSHSKAEGKHIIDKALKEGLLK